MNNSLYVYAFVSVRHPIGRHVIDVGEAANGVFSGGPKLLHDAGKTWKVFASSAEWICEHCDIIRATWPNDADANIRQTRHDCCERRRACGSLRPQSCGKAYLLSTACCQDVVQFLPTTLFFLGRDLRKAVKQAVPHRHIG